MKLQELFESTMLSESAFEKLKKNKKPLSADERELVMSGKAVWHHGPKGEATPAVWKSIDKKGNITYITNTHRLYQTSSTLKGCVKKYHDVVKGTS